MVIALELIRAQHNTRRVQTSRYGLQARVNAETIARGMTAAGSFSVAKNSIYHIRRASIGIESRHRYK